MRLALRQDSAGMRMVATWDRYDHAFVGAVLASITNDWHIVA